MNDKALTFRELKEFLGTLTEEQLDCDVVIGVVDSDVVSGVGADLEDQSSFDECAEYYTCYTHGVSVESTALDDGHPYLGIVVS
jgi:hypothetical protein